MSKKADCSSRDVCIQDVLMVYTGVGVGVTLHRSTLEQRPSNSQRDRTMTFGRIVFYLSYEGLDLANPEEYLSCGTRRITYPDYESRILMTNEYTNQLRPHLR